MLLRKARRRKLLIPAASNGIVGGFGNSGSSVIGYEGATVIEPIKGFYNCPVATLDFASLYPSIIMAHNLCYSTLVPSREVYRFPADMLLKSPTGDVFVKKEMFAGVLPEVL
uniref:DNA-directed DNA polymerase n=1 Tax=Lygus hesperus TaxID=30085 RepID=A0A0A9Z700_LYGHE